MAFSQYPLRCRFWAELTQNLSLSASWRRISWKNALRGGHFEAQKIENIPSHRKINFLVTTKYSGNPQPRSLRLIMLVLRAKVTQPLWTFWEIVKISPLISKWKSELHRQTISVVINLKLREKKIPKSSKKQIFWSLQSIQRTHNRDGYAKLSLGFELRRHNHPWHSGDRISIILLNNRQGIFGIYRGARHTLP